MISRDQLQRGAADGGFQIESYGDGASQWSRPAARELCSNASSGGTVS